MRTSLADLPAPESPGRGPSVRLGAKLGGAALAAALGVSFFAVTLTPAQADTGTTGSATATVGDTAFAGSPIHITGEGWTTQDGTAGSCLAVKLDGASTVATPAPAVPAQCDTGAGLANEVWAWVVADSDGSFSADIPFPTPVTTSPAISDTAWAVGTSHNLRLLTGLPKTGDTGRSLALNFTVAAPATTPTLADATATFSTSTTAGPSAALSGSGFAGGTVLSADLGGTALNFSGRGITAGPNYTVSSTGVVSGVNLSLPAATRAGSYQVTVHGDDGSPGGFDRRVTVTVNPALTWSAGTKPGSSGTLTVAGLPTDAVISQVRAGDTVVASSLEAADTDGSAAGNYTIPASAPVGQTSLTLTQANPAATYTIAGTIYPDETISGAGRFDIVSDSNDPALYQGTYQSAFSDKQNALYVSAASGTGASEDGYLYKLDPDTLAVEASAHPKELTDPDGVTGTAPYGVGVDDKDGTVWVTGTRTTSVAVYKASDLSLLKQYPSGTIDHPRDVVYDPATNYVFVSSASEGATGNGYLDVFEGGDNNHNGTSYELVKKIQTGPRSTFNPVSLSLDNGTLVSPSLSSNKVAVIDTAVAVSSPQAADGSLDASVRLIEIGQHSTAGNGRGGSGIAYDAADRRVFVASQNDNAVFVADSATGELLKTVPTGQQTLNVAYDKIHKLAYVTNFGGTSVTVLDKDGNKVAALPIARANHVQVTDGIAYVVDKASPTNHVWKITPRIETIDGVDLTDPTINGVTGSPDTTPLSVNATYGRPIHIEGTNFRVQDGTSGSVIGVKPASVSGSPTIATITADNRGTWSADVPFPSDWTVGSGQHLRLLTGSLKAGDTPRSIAIKVNVTALTLTAATPSINGTAQVGKTVTAATGSWTSGTSFSYQWLKNGAPIAGATKAGYAIPASLAGAKLSVKVTGSKAGYTAVSKTSAQKVVAKAALATHKPAIKGTAQVGKKLSAAPGKWTSGTAFKYQWNRNGKAIKGATKATYKVAKADIGKKLTVTVTGSKAGYTSVAKASAPVVAKAVAKVSAKLAKKSVSKKARAKLTVTVKASGATPTGKVTVFDGKKRLKVAALKKGKVTITLPKITKTGKHTLRVTYAGSAKVASKTSGKISLKITK